MNKTATEVVFDLVSRGMGKEAAIGGILNTRLAKQIIRDARKLQSNNKFLSKLPGYENFDTKFVESMANKGLKKLNAGAHSWDSDIYKKHGDILRRLRRLSIDGYEKGVLSSSLRHRREAFERMMKDVDPDGFIQKYKQKLYPVTHESYSGTGRRKWFKLK